MNLVKCPNCNKVFEVSFEEYDEEIPLPEDEDDLTPEGTKINIYYPPRSDKAMQVFKIVTDYENIDEKGERDNPLKY